MAMKAHLAVTAAIIVMLPRMVSALGPHELAVLVNTNSPRSVTVATEFTQSRHIPASNVIRLGLPGGQKSSLQLSPKEFTRQIWKPATLAIRRQGIEGHVLAWVYSVDFPVRIRTSPPISITGITFVRNQLPDAQAVARGSYCSALFAGPHSPDGETFQSQSFDVLGAWLDKAMPLPSMMLGFAGKRGTSLDVISECIRSGVRADHSAPSGTVFFVTGDDVRARSRAWQFPSAAKELRLAYVNAAIIPAPPTASDHILGIMMGAPTVAPQSYGQYIPGSFGEHLTSFAAVFDNAQQTKLTAWINAGATASAGTVTEPRANWRKFPNARFFVHYASGCSLMESFFQSVRCPLQTLCVGEPLARPWAPKAKLILRCPARPNAAGILVASARVQADDSRAYTRWVFLLDGKPKSDGTKSTIRLDTSRLSRGMHTLRTIAYGPGRVRNQAFAERTFFLASRPD